MVEARLPVVGGTARKPLFDDVGHRPSGTPDLNHLSRLWKACTPHWHRAHRTTRILGESIDRLLGTGSDGENQKRGRR